MSLAASDGTRFFPLPGEGAEFAAPALEPLASHRVFDLLARHYVTKASGDFPYPPTPCAGLTARRRDHEGRRPRAPVRRRNLLRGRLVKEKGLVRAV
jgi:hypothetical protein